MNQGPQRQMRGYSESLSTSPPLQAHVPGEPYLTYSLSGGASPRASEQRFVWFRLGPGHTARKDKRQGLFLRASGYHQELSCWSADRAQSLFEKPP